MIRKLMVILVCLMFCSVVYATGGYKTGAGSFSSETLDNVEHDLNTISKSVNLVAGRSLGSGQRTIPDKTGPMVLSKDTSIVEVKIRPLLTNTGKVIYIGGDANLDESNGYTLLSNDTELPLTLRVDNTTDVYLSCDVGGNGVSFIYTVK